MARGYVGRFGLVNETGKRGVVHAGLLINETQSSGPDQPPTPDDCTWTYDDITLDITHVEGWTQAPLADDNDLAFASATDHDHTLFTDDPEFSSSVLTEGWFAGVPPPDFIEPDRIALEYQGEDLTTDDPIHDPAHAEGWTWFDPAAAGALEPDRIALEYLGEDITTDDPVYDPTYAEGSAGWDVTGEEDQNTRIDNGQDQTTDDPVFDHAASDGCTWWDASAVEDPVPSRNLADGNDPTPTVFDPIFLPEFSEGQTDGDRRADVVLTWTVNLADSVVMIDQLGVAWDARGIVIQAMGSPDLKAVASTNAMQLNGQGTRQIDIAEQAKTIAATISAVEITPNVSGTDTLGGDDTFALGVGDGRAIAI